MASPLADFPALIHYGRAMPELALYSYWRSSSSYRVRFALAVKGVPYVYHPVNLLAGEQAAEEHRERSPMGYVPCLLVDGRPFVESVALLELLDDLFPSPPLYPKDPFDRARVRAMVEIVNAGTQPLQNLNVLARVSDDAAARTAWAKHFNERGLAALERMMQGHEALGIRGRFAYGDALTAADACLVPQVYSARRFGVDVDAFPRVRDAAAAAAATDAGRAAAPETQPDARPST
jgi:maleylacetoacetate isomerase